MRMSWLLGAVILVWAVGCGKTTEKVVEKAAEKAAEKAIQTEMGKDAKAEVDVQGGSVKIVSQDGTEQVSVSTQDGQTTVTSQSEGAKSVIGPGATVPENFPKDIPVYAGAEILVSAEDVEAKTYMVQARTKDPVETVGAYYKKELAGQGWTESQNVTQTTPAPMQMISFTKGERQLTVIIHSPDDATTLTIQTSGS